MHSSIFYSSLLPLFPLLVSFPPRDTLLYYLSQCFTYCCSSKIAHANTPLQTIAKPVQKTLQEECLVCLHLSVHSINVEMFYYKKLNQIIPENDLD